MKKLSAILVIIALVGGGLWLALALAIGTTSGGCPAALLQGTLVERNGTLAVESVPPGTVTTVTWPFGYGVGEKEGALVVTRLFSTVAREGDEVSVGGGMAADNLTWAGCGQVTLGLMFPSEEIPSEPVRAAAAGHRDAAAAGTGDLSPGRCASPSRPSRPGRCSRAS